MARREVPLTAPDTTSDERVDERDELSREEVRRGLGVFFIFSLVVSLSLLTSAFKIST